MYLVNLFYNTTVDLIVLSKGYFKHRFQKITIYAKTGSECCVLSQASILGYSWAFQMQMNVKFQLPNDWANSLKQCSDYYHEKKLESSQELFRQK